MYYQELKKGERNLVEVQLPFEDNFLPLLIVLNHNMLRQDYNMH